MAEFYVVAVQQASQPLLLSLMTRADARITHHATLANPLTHTDGTYALAVAAA